MHIKKHKKLINEGNYVAEVNVDYNYDENGWSPFLSLDDANKLDEVRDALRKGDIKSAAKFGRIFTLTPVAV